MNELRDFIDRLAEQVETDMRRKQSLCRDDQGQVGKAQQPRREWASRWPRGRKGHANDNAR
jgi:hypothetical protein